MKILLSGGSRGLGYELSARMLGAGHTVAAFARSATDYTDQLANKYPDTYVFRELDANDVDAMNAWVRELDKSWNGIDTLVNNAAVGQDSLLVHTNPEQIERIIATNLTAPIMLTRAVTRSMLRRGTKGQILFIGSICAQRGYAGLSVYSSTKGALDSFTRSLAHELKGRIAVNVVAPGFFESEMSSVLLPDQLKAIVRRTPSGVLSSPEQVAETVAFLLENDINMNGSVIPVDGGAST